MKKLVFSKKGFSLLELLLVIALLAIIGAIGSGFYTNYGKSVEVDSITSAIISNIKQAQSNSMIGAGGLKWGVHLVNGVTDYYEIFSTPTDYSNASKVVTSTNYLSNGVVFTTPAPNTTQDIIFNKISGGTTATSIVIAFTNSTATTINISSVGSITFSSSSALPVYCDGTGSTFTCGNSCIYNGDTYPTVQIGTQCWFAENLRTILYPNGSAITKGDAAQGSSAWYTFTTQYYSCPPNVTNTAEDCTAASDSNKLGYLYQWKTIMNGSSGVVTGAGPQGICPAGWQIPTDDNTASSGWGLLYTYVESLPGCTGASGTCLKVGGSTGFNMPFAGNRNASGNYVNRGTWFNLWSSSESVTNKSWDRRLYYTNTSFGQIDDWKTIGFNVRCLKN